MGYFDANICCKIFSNITRKIVNLVKISKTMNLPRLSNCPRHKGKLTSLEGKFGERIEEFLRKTWLLKFIIPRSGISVEK